MNNNQRSAFGIHVLSCLIFVHFAILLSHPDSDNNNENNNNNDNNNNNNNWEYSQQ